MLKVLDRGGLPAILETLNDGQPKLQQAYLNVINFLFASRVKVVEWYNKTKKLPGSAVLPDDPLSDLGVDGSGNTSVLRPQYSIGDAQPMRVKRNLDQCVHIFCDRCLVCSSEVV